MTEHNETTMQIALASFLGWEPDITCNNPEHWDYRRDNGNSVSVRSFHDLPKLGSLFNEAMERLTISQRTQWPMELRRIVMRDAQGQGFKNPDDTHFYNASTDQKCEALIITLGLQRGCK